MQLTWSRSNQVKPATAYRLPKSACCRATCALASLQPFANQRLGANGPALSKLLIQLPSAHRQAAHNQTNLLPYREALLCQYLQLGGNCLTVPASSHYQNLNMILERVGYSPEQTYLMHYFPSKLGPDPSRTIQLHTEKLLKQLQRSQLDMVWLTLDGATPQLQEINDCCLRLHQQGKIAHWGCNWPDSFQQGYLTAMSQYHQRHGFRASRWSMPAKEIEPSDSSAGLLKPTGHRLYYQAWWTNPIWSDLEHQPHKLLPPAAQRLQAQAHSLQLDAATLLFVYVLQNHSDAHVEIPLCHPLPLQRILQQLSQVPQLTEAQLAQCQQVCHTFLYGT